MTHQGILSYMLYFVDVIWFFHMDKIFKFSFKQKNRAVPRRTQIYTGNKQAFTNQSKKNDILHSSKNEKYFGVDDKDCNNSHRLLFEGLANDVTCRWSILFGQFPKNDARKVAKRAIYLRIRRRSAQASKIGKYLKLDPEKVLVRSNLN